MVFVSESLNPLSANTHNRIRYSSHNASIRVEQSQATGQIAMNRAKKVGVGVLCALGIALMAITFALFHGYLDHAQFEVKPGNWH
jgi:hypothetical protein